MLQQTGVKTVIPYYTAFLERWPAVDDLAAATLDEVLSAWAGLGYYSRARNLHACARAVAHDHDGIFPDAEESLRALPGVGAYTAAAVAAIAFDRPATVMDGNVERVMARLFAVEQPLPGAKPLLREKAESLTPSKRPGDYAQALMDLGATVCTPRKPNCLLCPLKKACTALARGEAQAYPKRAPKAEKPTRHGTVFWLTRKDGAVLLRRRDEKGLLGGMMELPATPWDRRTAITPPTDELREAHAPAAGPWRVLPGEVRHTFTHFHLRLEVWTARTSSSKAQGQWVSPEDFETLALPTVMKKVIAHAMDAED